MSETKKTILTVWGEEAAVFINSVKSYSLLAEIRKGRDIIEYRATILKINEKIVKRFISKSSGVSNKPIPMTRDFKNVYQREGPGQSIPQNILDALNLEIGENSILCIKDEIGEGRVLNEVSDKTSDKASG